MTIQTRTATQVQTRKLQASTLMLRRTCACGQHKAKGEECEACKEPKAGLQRHSSRPGAPLGVPSIVHDVLKSPGQPLDRSIRAFMEASFSHNFSHVRIHNDSSAAQSARTVNALAYTVGRDIVFDSGQFQPDTPRGKHILAHELTHVVQQQYAADQSKQDFQVGLSDDSAELEAHAVADSILSGSQSTSRLPSDLMVRRKQEGTRKGEEKAKDSPRLPDGKEVCASHGNQQALAKNPDFCRDTPFSGKKHAGFTCYREIPKGSGCPPGRHVCFKDGSCKPGESHTDEVAPGMKRDSKGFCDVSYVFSMCSVLHGYKDKALPLWARIGIGGLVGGGIGAALGGAIGGGLGAAIGGGVGIVAGGVLGGTA